MTTKTSTPKTHTRSTLVAGVIAAVGLAGCQTAPVASTDPNATSPANAQLAGQAQPSATPVGSPARPVDRTIRRSTLRERAISTLVEYAASNNALLRANSLEALAPAGPRLRAPLAAGLTDENEGVRAVAAVLVGRQGVDSLAPSVRPLLGDPSPLVRASAIYALKSVRAPVDPTPLGAFLLESPDPTLRAHAAFLLGELGDSSALPLLRQALHEEVAGATEQQERLLSLQVAEAMVKLGDKDRLEGIRAALYPARPDEYEIAVLATQILGRLGDRPSMGQLINLSEYTKNGRTVPAELRLAVADAAARMGRKEGWFIAETYIADPDPLRRSQAALVLGQTGRDEDLALLTGLLDDPNPLVRASAAGSILTITTQ